MTEPITKQELIDASEDALTLEDVVNGDDVTDVTSRLARTYPTLAKALRLIVQNGLLGATPFNLKSSMDASGLVNDDYAVVTDDPVSENNGFYQKRAGVFEFLAWNPINQFLTALAVEVANRSELIRAGDDAFVDKYGFVIAEFIAQGIRLFVPLIADQLDIKNGDGDLVASFGSALTKLLSQTVDFGGLKVTNDGGQFDIKDGGGFTLASFLSDALAVYLNRINFGGLSIIDDGATGLNLQDAAGFTFDLFALLSQIVAAQQPPVVTLTDCTKPLFSNKLVGWANDTVTIDAACLLDDRVLQRTQQNVIASLSSQTKPYSVVADNVITIPRFSDVGTSAYLTLRDKRVANLRTRLLVDCVAVPDTTESVVVHMIGDSIGNRGGGALLKEYLLAHGYTSTYVGTLVGTSRDAASTTAIDGELGECREGWTTSDFTYAVTTRTPVSAGGEAAYLALSKSSKGGRCPYIRLTTGGDNPAFVKNGYIFDFAFYLSRFSLATPQVVTIGLGTNDVAALANPTLATAFYSNMTIMITQIRAAVTNVPIIIYIPATPHEAEREQLWTDEYTVVIRELQKLATDLDVILAPTWALTTVENGYAMSVQSTDTVSGAQTGGFADRVHPTFTPRYQLYNALSAYVAAARSALI